MTFDEFKAKVRDRFSVAEDIRFAACGNEYTAVVIALNGGRLDSFRITGNAVSGACAGQWREYPPQHF